MWQPIETAPKDGTRILIFVPGDLTWKEESTGTIWPSYHAGIHAARFEQEPQKWVMGDEFWSDDAKVFQYEEPTHWMPLPEPPR